MSKYEIWLDCARTVSQDSTEMFLDKKVPKKHFALTPI